MALNSFIQAHPDSHIPIQNLPYGAFKLIPNAPARLTVAIGDYVLDLSEIDRVGLFNGPILTSSFCFLQPTLNKFLALEAACLEGSSFYTSKAIVMGKIEHYLDYAATEPILRDNVDLRQKSLVTMSKVEMVLPIEIGDYTDFFSSMHHAKNCGTIFHGPQNPIPQNWFYLPIAYHGRASSIFISGTNIIRPRGQGYPTGDSPPYFGPSLKLDFELEMVYDMSISPRIVTLDALEPFASDASKQESISIGCDPHSLPYLAEKISKNYDFAFEVQIKPSGQNDSSVVTRSNCSYSFESVF
ncbi:hypothetical protein PTKIN_Ptkin18bG0152700 [Pterospermum kingtungense]